MPFGLLHKTVGDAWDGTVEEGDDAALPVGRVSALK